jgi:hypothetical protein
MLYGREAPGLQVRKLLIRTSFGSMLRDCPQQLPRPRVYVYRVE